MLSGPPVEEQALPHSVGAEKAVLGAVLKDADNLAIVEGMLEPAHFFLDAHQKIFSSINDLSTENESVDILTVSERLRSAEGDRQYLGPAYLVELTENCPLTQNVEHYAKYVRQYFFMRRIVIACRSTAGKAMQFDGTIESFVEEVEKEFLEITSSYDRKGIVPADKVLLSTIDEIQRRIAMEGKITGVPTGFNDLDGLTGGFQPSDLIILAARPGMGKTALALNVATNAAFAGKSVVIFTLEMSKEQLMTRVLSTTSRVDSRRLSQGDLTEDEQDRLMAGARQIHDIRDTLAIDETPGITLMEIRSRCRRYHKEHGLDMVIIDYLQIMGSTGNANDNREREISKISMGLKELAKELSIPVIALAQLNRTPDSRPDKRPKISDLRESGSLEQDADLVLFVYRDEYYNPDSEITGISEVIVGKNRHGSLTTVKLAYLPHFVSFQNLYQGGESAAPD